MNGITIGKWMDWEAEIVKLQRIADARPNQFIHGSFVHGDDCGCLGGIAEGWNETPLLAPNAKRDPAAFDALLKHPLYGAAGAGGAYERLCQRFGADGWTLTAPPRVVRMLQDRARRALATRRLASLPVSHTEKVGA